MSANYCQGRKKSLGYFLNKNWEINCMLYIHIFTLCIGKYSYPVNIYKLRGGEEISLPPHKNKLDNINRSKHDLDMISI